MGGRWETPRGDGLVNSTAPRPGLPPLTLWGDCVSFCPLPRGRVDVCDPHPSSCPTASHQLSPETVSGLWLLRSPCPLGLSAQGASSSSWSLGCTCSHLSPQ